MPPTNTMLVGISFGMPRQSRKLTTVAGEIEDRARAQRGTVKASMFYFRRYEGTREVDGLRTLKTFQSSWKSAVEHYARYPFSVGMKLLPAALAAPAIAENDKFLRQEDAMRDLWLKDEYPEWLRTAPDRMGSLYEPDDFPSVEDCRRRFKCGVVIIPLAETDQWQRITAISPDLAATMAASQNEAVERVTREAHAKLWADVMKPIQNIVDQLSKDKGKIYDSLIGNVISITDLIPAYNEIHKDSNLTALAQQVKAKLAEIKPDDIRKSSDAKADALAKAQGIIKEFEPYARKFDLDDE